MDNKIIAVDFDGTLCKNAWPKIGEPIMAWIDYVKEQQRDGAKLILWTNRVGERLQEAVEWCKGQGIVFDAVNENLPEIIEYFGNDCRKIFANEYLDDRAKPAQRGHWIEHGGGLVATCSNCNVTYRKDVLQSLSPYAEHLTRHCPQCGSRNGGTDINVPSKTGGQK